MNSEAAVSSPDLSSSAAPIFWALLLAFVFSIAVSFYGISDQSKARAKAVVESMPSYGYMFFVTIGNLVTTLLVTPVVVKVVGVPSVFQPIIFAFLGVFGFEIILKHTNVTMFDHGVLTIRDWTQKALNVASEAALRKDSELHSQSIDQAVDWMMVTSSEQDINTRILHHFDNPGMVEELDIVAAKSRADAKRYKCLKIAATLTKDELAAGNRKAIKQQRANQRARK